METAVQAIYRDLDYARGLIRDKAAKNGAAAAQQQREPAHGGGVGVATTPALDPEPVAGIELGRGAEDEGEEWTLVGGGGGGGGGTTERTLGTEMGLGLGLVGAGFGTGLGTG